MIKTIALGAQPWGIAIDDDDDTVYVAARGGVGWATDKVLVINGATGDDTLTQVDVGDNPEGIAVDVFDDTVYVANSADDSLSVFNGATLGIAPITINAVGNNPKGVAVDQDDDTVYVALYGDDSIAVINGRTASLLSPTIPVGNGPRGVAVNNQDDTVYVSNYGGENSGVGDGITMTVIDGRQRNVAATVPVLATGPLGVVVNQQDDTVFTGNSDTNNVSLIASLVAGATPTSLSRTAVGSRPFFLAIDQDDDTVYALNYGSNYVSIINGSTGVRSDDTIAVGANPFPGAVDNDGLNRGLLYVGNLTSKTLNVIGRATTTASPTSGAAGTAVTLSLNVPGVTYAMDDTTIKAIKFNGSLINTPPSRVAGQNQWTFTVPAGTPGSTVDIEVQYQGNLWASAGSFTYVNPTPPPTPVFPPSAPLNVSATAGNQQATVAWQAPASSGTYPVSSYTVTAAPGGRTCTVAAPALTCTVTGLTNGTAYTFTVRASSDAGTSDPSAPSTAVTPSSSVTYTTPGLYMCTVDGSTGSKTIPFTVKGGKGGTGNMGTVGGAAAVPNAGGLGASVSGSFDAEAGTKFALTVGSNGLDAGTFDAGKSAGGGGGGYSAISRQPTSDPIVVAGGGGGGSYFNAAPVSGSSAGAAPSSTRTPRASTPLNWKRGPAPAKGWGDVAYGDGTFVAVRASTGQPAVMTSPDGANWTGRDIPGNASGANPWDFRGVAYGNGTFIGVGTGASADGNRIIRSTDQGQTWQMIVPPTGSDPWDVTYGNGRFVAVGRTGKVIYSTDDGRTWQSTSKANSWRSVTYGNGLFVAVADSGTNRVMTSTNGVSWTYRSAPNSTWEDVTYGGGQYVAVATTGAKQFMTSPDGIAWAGHPGYRPQGNERAWSGVAYGDGRYIAVATQGFDPGVISSPDGITWTPEWDAQGGLYWSKITYGADRFVVVSLSIGPRPVQVMWTTPPSPAGTFGGKGGDSDPSSSARGAGDGGNVGLPGSLGGTLATAGAGGVASAAGGPGGAGGAAGIAGATATGGSAGGGGGGFGAVGGSGSAPDFTGTTWSSLPGAHGGGGGGGLDGGGGGGGYAGGGGGAGGAGTAGAGGGGGGSSLLVSASTAAGITNKVDGTLAANSSSASITVEHLTCTFGVTYLGNGNTAGTVPTDAQWYAPGASATAALAPTLRKGELYFAGWATTQFGPVAYAPGATIRSLQGPVTLWAVYATAKTVTFDANGGTGTMAPQEAAAGEPLAEATFTREGYAFAGWNTRADGTGTKYADGATYPFASDATLYAQWVLLKTVTFDANGGAGTMAPQKDGVPSALDVNTFTRNGDAFFSWNTKADGTGTSYDNGAEYNFAEDITLYAQWDTMPEAAPEEIPEELEPGDALVQLDGVVAPIEVLPNPQDNGLTLDDSNWTMTLTGLGAGNKPLALSPEGALILEVERNARTTGTGFLAQSDVTLYFNPPVAGGQGGPETVELGTVPVGFDGTFDGMKPLPASIRPGNHVLQAVGFGPKGQRRTLSIGVVVRPWISLNQGTRTADGTHDRIRTSGGTGGIDPGTRLTPWIRYDGQAAFTQGKATITVQSDGTYRWTRQIKKSKGLTAYVSWTDIESNRIYWKKVR